MDQDQRDRSIMIERACSADVKPSVNIIQFNLSQFIFTEGITSFEHALSMCILRSLCSRPLKLHYDSTLVRLKSLLILKNVLAY